MHLLGPEHILQTALISSNEVAISSHICLTLKSLSWERSRVLLVDPQARGLVLGPAVFQGPGHSSKGCRKRMAIMGTVVGREGQAHYLLL